MFRDAFTPATYYIQANGAPAEVEDPQVESCMPPAGTPVLSRPDKFTLSWSSLPGALTYDVDRGDLQILRSTGSFTSSVAECLADDTSSTFIGYAQVPTAGQGFWFLVRGVGCGCVGGTFDTGAPKQVASRDASIEASNLSCP